MYSSTVFKYLTTLLTNYINKVF